MTGLTRRVLGERQAEANAAYGASRPPRLAIDSHSSVYRVRGVVGRMNVLGTVVRRTIHGWQVSIKAKRR